MSTHSTRGRETSQSGAVAVTGVGEPCKTAGQGHYARDWDWTEVMAPAGGATGPARRTLPALLLRSLHRLVDGGRPRISSSPAETRRWALRMLRPGSACILDVETTGLDGAIVEIAIIDAATGLILLSTLVNPECAIPADASTIHGITDAEVALEPTWTQVLPAVVAAVGARTVIAYNAAFDRDRVIAECRRADLPLPRFTRRRRWHCLMRARSAWLATSTRLRLNGPHRALGDTLAARTLLLRMVAGALDDQNVVALHRRAPLQGPGSQPGLLPHRPRRGRHG